MIKIIKYFSNIDFDIYYHVVKLQIKIQLVYGEIWGYFFCYGIKSGKKTTSYIYPCSLDFSVSRTSHLPPIM
jgi:hypothetical protein